MKIPCIRIPKHYSLRSPSRILDENGKELRSFCKEMPLIPQDLPEGVFLAPDALMLSPSAIKSVLNGEKQSLDTLQHVTD